MADLKLDDVLVFVQVVESGGMTAAAKRSGLSKSSVSRCLARLESELGVRLLQRSSRSITLTEAGRHYFEQVAPHAKGIVAASAEAGKSKLSGTVRFAAPYDFGAEALPELMARFCQMYPELDLDLHLTSETPNLIEDALDFAIVGGPQPSSSLVIRKLRATDFRLYASPAYLARAGMPASADVLADHRAVLFGAADGRSRWQLSGPGEEVFEVEVRGRLTSNSLIVARRAAIAGLGIALLPEVPGELAVLQGQLQRVLPELRMSTSPLYLVHASSDRMPSRVRLFRDFIVEHFPTLDDFAARSNG